MPRSSYSLTDFVLVASLFLGGGSDLKSNDLYGEWVPFCFTHVW